MAFRVIVNISPLRLYADQKGFSLVELMVALVTSAIVLIGIAVIVDGSHKHIIKGRNKSRLQQDYSLIERFISKRIHASIRSRRQIFSDYASYTGSGSTQTSGSCLKLYYPAGDSMVIYKDNSDLKVLHADLTTADLVLGVVNNLTFTDNTMSIQTQVSLQKDRWTLTDTFGDDFRNSSDTVSAFLSADFDTSEAGFTYTDDVFRSTNEPVYATGTHLPSGGHISGGLKVSLGEIDDSDILGMSGGWQRSFTLSGTTSITVSFKYRLILAADYETDEYSEMLVSLDGTLYGTSPNDYVARLTGDGNGGIIQDTGWKTFYFNVASLSSGPHSLILGGYGSKKTYRDESSDILIDDVLVATSNN